MSTVVKCSWCCYFYHLLVRKPVYWSAELLPYSLKTSSQFLRLFHKCRNQFCEVPSPLQRQNIYANTAVSIVPSIYDTGTARQVLGVDKLSRFSQDMSCDPTPISKRRLSLKIYVRPFPSTMHRVTPFSSPPSSFTKSSPCGGVIIRSTVPWITRILSLPTWSPNCFSCAALL